MNEQVLKLSARTVLFRGKHTCADNNEYIEHVIRSKNTIQNYKSLTLDILLGTGNEKKKLACS